MRRVVVGTAAVDDPDWVRRLAARHPGRVAVGLDARGREVAVRGWTEGSGRDLVEVARQFDDAGVAALVVTEIGRDGTLDGPALDQLSDVLAATTVDVVASGGVGSLDDLRALAALEVDGRRLAGAIVGRALYEGAFPLADAVAGGRRCVVVRVIPCLDVDAGRVVKGVNFVDLRDAGDPVELAARYDAEGADELVFLDITASSDARDTMVDVVRRTAEQVFIPFTVGGGIRLGRRRPPAAAGRRRQGVGQHRGRRAARARRRDGRRVRRPVRGRGHRRPPRATAAASRCSPTAGARPTGSTPSRGPRQVAELGAGEILLTSMDRDGTKEGFDLELTRAVADAVGVPVIASGGVGTLDHLVEGVIEGGADAVLAASIFHFGEHTVAEAKDESWPPPASPSARPERQRVAPPPARSSTPARDRRATCAVAPARKWSATGTASTRDVGPRPRRLGRASRAARTGRARAPCTQHRARGRRRAGRAGRREPERRRHERPTRRARSSPTDRATSAPNE